MNHSAERSPRSDRLIARRQVLGAGLGLGAAAALTPLLDACGSGSSSAKASSGGTLRIGGGGQSTAETLDAHDEATSYEDTLRKAQLYEPLAYPGPDNQLVMVLAESMEPTSSAGTSWIVRLKQGLEFHNGKTVTSEDVLYSYRRILTPSAELPAASGKTSLQMINIADVKIHDKYTIEFPLLFPDAYFQWDVGQWFNGIVPVGYNPHKPVGTGPFKYQSFIPGQSSTFTKFANYWETGHPYVDTLFVQSIGDQNARLNALFSGQVQLVQNLSPFQVSQLKSQGAVLLESQTGGYLDMAMNATAAPFDDVRVRQAFRLLINRQEFLQLAQAGYGAIANDLYGRFDPDVTVFPAREHDLSEAKSLLKAAGVVGQSITFSYASGTAAGEDQMAQLLQQQAGAAGLDIRVNELDPATFYGANYHKWQFSLHFWPQTRSYVEQALLTNYTNCPYPETHWASPAFVRAIAAARATIDISTRRQHIREAEQLAYDQGGELIPFFTPDMWAHQPSLVGLVQDKYGTIGVDTQIKNVKLTG